MIQQNFLLVLWPAQLLQVSPHMAAADWV